MQLGRGLPPLGNGPRGQGQCPCTPHRIGRHAARPGFYRRSATGLAARNAGQRVFGNPFGLLPCKIGHAFPLQFNPQGLRSISTHAAAKQSGDRQRREKGSPILTAEKGEHERAPYVSDSYPTPLRATLRAPPSKWAIGAFFPESPCRVLSLVLSFASKESTAPRGAAVPPSAP